MSLTITIAFFIFGFIISIISFRKDFKATKKWNRFKITLLLAFLGFISLGIWDAVNKTNDAKSDKNEIIDSGKNQAASTGLKIDNVGTTVEKSSEKTNQKLDTGFNKLIKKQVPRAVYSAIIGLGATTDGKTPKISKTEKADSLIIDLWFSNYGRGTAFNII